MEFAQTAWTHIEDIYQKIINHPFNVELMQGTLAKNIFCYYIEQDSLYLHDFAKALATIASRCDNPEHIVHFLDFSKEVFLVEQNIVHEYFKTTFKCSASSSISPACLGYTSYLLAVAQSEPVEVAIAAVLPCFWIYREVGKHIYNHTKQDNAFYRWVETYADSDFSTTVDIAIQIFNRVSQTTTDSIRKKMLQAFEHSSLWEFYFWDDAYNYKKFALI